MDMLNLMNKIQIENALPQLVSLPNISREDIIYEINIQERTIQGPSFLSVLKDHSSETVYFSVDRYYDHMDLSQTHCVIYYITPDQKPHLYIVPYFDIEVGNQVLYDENNEAYVKYKIVFPWLIDGIATQQAGTIQYCVQFFKFNKETESLSYQLTTLPTSGQILYGLDTIDPNQINYMELLDTDLERLLNVFMNDPENVFTEFGSITTLRSVLEAIATLYYNVRGPYWTILPDEI